jgi:rubrerythrin
MSIKGTKTEQNLLKSFAGESQARNRYTMFAKIAKKEGYEQIADLFLETADNELEHAKTFFRYLEGGNVEITAAYPAGVEGTTEENLMAAAMGEHEERYLKLANNIKEDIVFKTEDATVWFCRKCGHIHVAKQAPGICPVCNHPRAYFERKKENY